MANILNYQYGNLKMTEKQDKKLDSFEPVLCINGLEAQLRHLLIAKNELTKMFESQERSFALDGHLIGSIGEVVCSYLFNLRLLGNSTEQFDAETVNEPYKKVQIKISAKKKFNFKNQHLTQEYKDTVLILIDLNSIESEHLLSVRFIGTLEKFLGGRKYSVSKSGVRPLVVQKEFYCSTFPARRNDSLWIYTPQQVSS
jgi:hypothetical protein